VISAAAGGVTALRNQTVVIAVGSSSHATHLVVRSGRRQQARYSPIPAVIALHAQQ
jgi:hypothetical protein